jgi:hypothetical protein
VVRVGLYTGCTCLKPCRFLPLPVRSFAPMRFGGGRPCRRKTSCVVCVWISLCVGLVGRIGGRTGVVRRSVIGGDDVARAASAREFGSLGQNEGRAV